VLSQELRLLQSLLLQAILALKISSDHCAFVAQSQTLIFPFIHFFSTRAQTRFESELLAYTNRLNLGVRPPWVKKIGDFGGEAEVN
jgi:hypothetical protein